MPKQPNITSIVLYAQDVLGIKQGTRWLTRFNPEIGGLPIDLAETEPEKVILVLQKIENGVY